MRSGRVFLLLKVGKEKRKEGAGKKEEKRKEGKGEKKERMRKKKREPYGSRLWGTEKFKRFLGGGEKRF